MLNDFLAKQPIDVIINTEITEKRVIFPNKIDSDAFYKEFSSKIESSHLTTEKSLYIGSIHKPKKYISALELLNSKNKY